VIDVVQSLVQRVDDQPEKIKIRLKEYNETIGPIVETYKNRGILIEIDASPTIEEIHTQLVQKLGL